MFTQFTLNNVISLFSYNLNEDINDTAISDVKRLFEILKESKLLPTDKELEHLLEMGPVKKQLAELYAKLEKEQISEEYVSAMQY